MEELDDIRAATLARNARLAALPLQQTGTRGALFVGFFHSIRDIWQRRELLRLLIAREVKARYKDSVLGFAWGLVRPLTQLLIYYLVLGHFLGAARSIPEFAVYIFAGLTIYGLASEILQVMTGSIVANAGLVKKVYLPREIFPLAGIGSAGFNFALQLLILTAAALVTGTFVLGWNLLFALAAVVLILIYGLAIGLALSAINVYLRDMQYLIEVIVMLMMWASPIVYSWQFVGDAFVEFGIPSWLLEVYLDNPMTLAVLGFQAAFWAPGAGEGAIMPEHLALRMLIAGLIGLVLVFLAQRIFARLQGNFAQEL